MIISRRLKYIEFVWNEDEQLFRIRTFDRKNPNQVTGRVYLNKTYMFSVLRFIVRITQRMWGRRRKK